MFICFRSSYCLPDFAIDLSFSSLAEVKWLAVLVLQHDAEVLSIVGSSLLVSFRFKFVMICSRSSWCPPDFAIDLCFYSFAEVEWSAVPLLECDVEVVSFVDSWFVGELCFKYALIYCRSRFALSLFLIDFSCCRVRMPSFCWLWRCSSSWIQCLLLIWRC